MSAYFRALWAELLKLRRTLAFWMVLITPLLLHILNLGMILSRPDRFVGGEENPWLVVFHNIIALWAMMALPLFITLETALLGNTESANQQWKHLYALPVPRWAHYLSKWTAVVILVVLATLALVFEGILTSLVLVPFVPELGLLNASIPVWEMLRPVLLASLMSLLIISIHTWVSLRFQSFTVGIGVGMAAVLGIIVLSNWEYGTIAFPWLLMANVLSGENLRPDLGLLIGIAGGVVMLVAGGLEVTSRDIL